MITLKKENQRLSGVNEESSERIRFLEEQSAQSRVLELQKLASECQREVEQLRETLQEQKSRNALLESTNRTLQATTKSLRREIHGLKKSLAQERKRNRHKSVFDYTNIYMTYVWIQTPK